MFDTLLKTSSKAVTRDEIDRYLATDTEDVKNVLSWWWERKSLYPCLSRMALDYLSIPGMIYFFVN
jgi:hAT family C-terminal dimerisation region